MYDDKVDKRYLVVGVRYSQDTGEENTFETEIIGSFPEIGAAVICRDVYADLDTTFDEIAISSVRLFDEVPEIEVYLNFVADEDNIIIRSQCLPMGTEPTLRDDKDCFEAVVYLEDKEDMIDYAKRWFVKYRKKNPGVIDLISPNIESYEF